MPRTRTTPTAAERLAALEPACTTAEALALYDDLPAVRPEEITGRYHGRELATGHAMDGLLVPSGWYGKQFDSVDAVHPLLFSTPKGEIFAVDPRKVPLGLVGKAPAALVDRSRALLAALKPAVRTRKPRARLRAVEHRGVVTAAMVYDHLPIIDVFRRVDETMLLGVMDLRIDPQPYFFILEKDPA
ncbi:DUF4334 domain-containing protein [Nocardioides sp. MH1]|uniref:DUF4334 domain-containing protein n=1 Tax=Nocardioides sp. MH1 TaxID=3242490 RepID=UPI00351FF12A